MMNEIGENVKKLMLLGIGAVAATAEKSKEVVDELVKKGELTVEQGKTLNEELKHNIKQKVNPENLLWIIGAAVLLFAISFLGKKAEWFLNLVLRSVFGVIFMYFLNWGIEILGFTVAVGINAATALTVGILGFPGILVLYGLAVYHML